MARKLNYQRGARIPMVVPEGRATCTKCDIEKSFSDFYHFTYEGKFTRRKACKTCYKIYQNSFYKGYTPEQRVLRNKSSCEYNDRIRDKGLCGNCHERPRNGTRVYCAECTKSQNAKIRKSNDEIRDLVFDHYGRKCACPHCDIDIQGMLTIDHIGGWGKDHKMRSGKRYGGIHLYCWIVRNNFPDTFQTLCFNCNCSQAYTGKCAHETGYYIKYDDSKLTREIKETIWT